MKILSTLLLLSLMTGATCAAPKPLRTATAAQMQVFIKLYKRGDEHALRRDFPALSREMTPDFTARSLSGKTSNRAGFLRFMASFYRQIIKFNASTSTIEKLSFRGKQALTVVAGTGDFTARAHDKKVHRFHVVTRSTETWILTGRGWMTQSTTVLAEKLFIDGRFAR